MNSSSVCRSVWLIVLTRAVCRRSLRTGAPLLIVACTLGSGCTRCDVKGIDGCYSASEYRKELEGTATDIRSSPSFEDRWGLEAIKLAEAWAHLRLVRGSEQPGLGVTVGVLDTGIDLSHPTFSEGAEAGAVTEEFILDATDEAGVEFSHGTGVASIIAGRVNPMYRFPFTGIVPRATLKMFAIPLGDPPPPDKPFEPVTLSELAPYDEEDADLYWEVLSRDLDILNLSFGVQGLVENYGDVPALRATLPKTIEALAQTGRDDKTILVWAAGNANERLCRPGTDNCAGDTETDYLGRPAGILDASSPSVFSGLTAYIEELRGHSIAVVATGEDGEIAFFSHRCGIAADWCIAAPGYRVWAAYFGPYQGEILRGYARLSGTSFSAPMVTGGLALMKHFFRDQLTSGELVTRLFRTADRSDRYADRSVYGQGLMDLDAALSPVGEPTIPTEATTARGGTPVGQARLQLGGPFGNGLARALARHEIVGFDSLGAPFWYDLGRLVVLPASPSPGAQIRDFMDAPPIDARNEGTDPTGSTAPAGSRLSIRETPGGADIGHALLARDAIALTFGRSDRVAATAFTTDGVGSLQPTSGALVSWRPLNAALGLRAGWLGERNSMLSATAEGAFGGLAAHSVFMGFELDHKTGGWRLSGGPEIGVVRSRARSGIISEIKPLATSAFALHASRPTGANGTLLLSLAQPLRVEGGSAVLSVPVGRTRDREIVRRKFSADLTPSGRQLDLSVRWERPLARGLLRLGATATRHPAHDAEARPRLDLLAGWRASF